MTTQLNTPEQQPLLEGCVHRYQSGVCVICGTPEQPKREACEEAYEVLRRRYGYCTIEQAEVQIKAAFCVALSTQAEELERAIIDKEAMQEERNDAQSLLDDRTKELEQVKAELAAVRDELADMEFEAANLTDGADWQKRSMRLKHRVSLLGNKLDALLK